MDSVTPSICVVTLNRAELGFRIAAICRESSPAAGSFLPHRMQPGGAMGRDHSGRFGLLLAPRRRLRNGSESCVPAVLYRKCRGHHCAETQPDELAVYALNDFKLQVDLRAPTPFFLQLVSSRIFCAVPRRAIEANGPSWTEPGRMVSSGAFKLTDDVQTSTLSSPGILTITKRLGRALRADIRYQ